MSGRLRRASFRSQRTDLVTDESQHHGHAHHAGMDVRIGVMELTCVPPTYELFRAHSQAIPGCLVEERHALRMTELKLMQRLTLCVDWPGHTYLPGDALPPL